MPKLKQRACIWENRKYSHGISNRRDIYSKHGKRNDSYRNTTQLLLSLQDTNFLSIYLLNNWLQLEMFFNPQIIPKLLILMLYKSFKILIRSKDIERLEFQLFEILCNFMLRQHPSILPIPCCIIWCFLPVTEPCPITTNIDDYLIVIGFHYISYPQNISVIGTRLHIHYWRIDG